MMKIPVNVAYTVKERKGTGRQGYPFMGYFTFETREEW